MISENKEIECSSFVCPLPVLRAMLTATSVSLEIKVVVLRCGKWSNVHRRRRSERRKWKEWARRRLGYKPEITCVSALHTSPSRVESTSGKLKCRAGSV